MNTTVAVIILAAWALAATIAMALALRSRSRLNTENTRLRVKLGSAQDLAEAWKKVADSRKESSRDDAIPTLAQRIRTLTEPIGDRFSRPNQQPSRINRGPATFRPSLQTTRHPSTDRPSYDDGSISNALMFGALASTWNDTTPSSSDSSPSSSSSDSGSFSGGDSGSF